MARAQTTVSQDKSLGIYVHIPFCRSKCQYCDFYSLPRSEKTPELMDRYVKAVCAHITEGGARATKYEVDSIYFGGGTPSYFGAERLRQIYTTITRKFNVSKSAEVTLEANPESLDARKCKRLLSTGFNRISIGVQTNDDQLLKYLGRPHTFRQARQAVDIARDAGFDNVSIDLMYGLPAQSPQAWADSLGSVIDLQPEHISCYGLTLEPNTPLYQYRNQAALPGDDAQAAMYLYACSTLEAYGYRHYEISNFAQPGRECRHNLKYWLGGEYMSFGPSAASDFAGTRYTFASDLPRYIRAINTGDSITTECEYIPIKERAGEYLMLRLRTNRGVRRDEYETTFLMSFAALEQKLTFFANRGLARYRDGRWTLTPQGMLVSNQVIGQLIEIQRNPGSMQARRR